MRVVALRAVGKPPKDLRAEVERVRLWHLAGSDAHARQRAMRRLVLSLQISRVNARRLLTGVPVTRLWSGRLPTTHRNQQLGGHRSNTARPRRRESSGSAARTERPPQGHALFFRPIRYETRYSTASPGGRHRSCVRVRGTKHEQIHDSAVGDGVEGPPHIVSSIGWIRWDIVGIPKPATTFRHVATCRIAAIDGRVSRPAVSSREPVTSARALPSG